MAKVQLGKNCVRIMGSNITFKVRRPAKPRPFAGGYYLPLEGGGAVVWSETSEPVYVARFRPA